MLSLSLVSCDTVFGPAAANDSVLDGAIEDLSASQLRAHVAGDDEFGKIFSDVDGLGPIFNAASCESCHIGDGRGHSGFAFLRFGKANGDVVDHMLDEGGPQLQDRSLPGFAPEYLPASANVHSRFLAPPVTGLGYLEAVEDSVILASEDPNDKDGDGISGVGSFVALPPFVELRSTSVLRDGKVLARFGRKAGAVDLVHQTVNAYFNDMGLSSDYHPLDIENVQSEKGIGDLVPEPEVSSATINSVVFYLRTLKVPPRRRDKDAAVVRGEKIFQNIGCASCHSPTLVTGASAIASLSKKEIHPYTDMLLHDMGAELNDGYTEASAKPGEWRTAPLWGLGLAGVSTGSQVFYLHDGRARTLSDAIMLHGGEGSASRAKYKALSVTEQQDLVQFLESL